MPSIRVQLPYHLRNLAKVQEEVQLDLEQSATLNSVLDALEFRYPALRGSIRDYHTGQRRPFVRFFACKEDFSHAPPDALLPDEIVMGKEPLLIVGAMAGG
jgi:sulfur-carrier protein